MSETWTSKIYSPPMTSKQLAEAIVSSLESKNQRNRFSYTGQLDYLIELMKHIDVLVGDDEFTKKAISALRESLGED